MPIVLFYLLSIRTCIRCRYGYLTNKQSQTTNIVNQSCINTTVIVLTIPISVLLYFALLLSTGCFPEKDLIKMFNLRNKFPLTKGNKQLLQVENLILLYNTALVSTKPVSHLFGSRFDS